MTPLKWLLLLPRNVLISPVLLWRKVISPTYGNVCRYYPSCSSYGLQSLQRLGVFKGLPLTLWRIIRCNPWSDGGVDEVRTGPNWIAIGRLGFVIPNTQRKQG
jgi:putative membrane protein insertion efficiency factor